MTQIITVAQQKGGAGKTTLAAHLAVEWARRGQHVAALDIDPQGSLTSWAEARGSADGVQLTCASVTGWRAESEVRRLAVDHDIVIIDSPPHAETEAKIAVRAAALVLIPVQPSPMDVWATKATLKLAKTERRPVLMVLNRVPPRSKLTERMEAMVGEMGAALAATRIGNRTGFATAMLRGRAVVEEPRKTRAGEEIQQLADEVLLRLSCA
jgi:chromosome partitioning protein